MNAILKEELRPLSVDDKSRLEACEERIERGFETFYDVGLALLEIRDSKLYRENYRTFADYCQGRWGIKKRYSYNLMDAAKVVKNLTAIDEEVRNCAQNVDDQVIDPPKTESQARPLAQLDTPEDQREAWQEAVEKAESEGRKVTAKDVQESVEQRKNPSQYITQSNDNEWYTPQKYIEAAREVLGGFDLDPASNPLANETVKAETFYTKEESGLDKPWKGRLWLNPPYGKECSEFVSKLVSEYEEGNVQSAILLVNANSTDTGWFQPLWEYVLCFTNHRINFYQSSGDQRNGSTHGSVFVYLGDRPHLFAKSFGRFGAVVERFATA